jgi:hypothetical protein
LPPSPARWTYGASSALRGIYLLRYLLFSGGLSIAGAMVHRAALKSERPVLGLAVGLLIGLFLFRSQLRPLSWPRLVLSQNALYLVQRQRAVTLPWASISKVAVEGTRVSVQLKAPMTSPSGEVADQIQLESRMFAAGAAMLGAALSAAVENPSERGRLPDDGKVRQLLKLG